MEKKLKSVQCKCASCGGNLIYSPKTKDLFCEKCSNHVEIKNNNKIELHDIYKNYQKDESYKEFVNSNNIFKCANCGSNVVLNKFEITKKCPYCSADLVISDEQMPGLKPDAVIPFDFDKEEASNLFAKNVSKRFFVPNKFKKNIPTSDISGIYIPSFGFYANTISQYNGELYTEHATTDADGHQSTYREYFHVSGAHTCDFADVMVESSSKITQNEINGFLPYKCKEKKAYCNEYILGYSVEHFNQTVSKCVPTYKSIVSSAIRKQILRKYSYDGVNYLNVETEYHDEKFLYYLLPVYRFEYKYNGKKYITYMNGQTGKVDSNVPKSGFKIAMVILLAILILLLPIIIGIISGVSE